jgi:thymidine kinase
MITLICGPMYSGKSTALFQRMERLLYAKKKILLIRPIKDDRGYFTHSNGIDINKLLKKFSETLKVVYWANLSQTPEMLEELSVYDAVFVDEYFMIPGISYLCHQNDFDVYYGGLLATSECKLFDEAIKILPYADKIKKLNGICVDCGSELGNYSFADFEKKEEIVVGDAKYKCLCKKCYDKRLKSDK